MLPPFILINIERVRIFSFYLASRQILPTSPSEMGWVARSQHLRYTETTTALYILQIFCSFLKSYLSHFVIVIMDHMLDWHLCKICYPLQIKYTSINAKSQVGFSSKINMYENLHFVYITKSIQKHTSVKVNLLLHLVRLRCKVC